MIIDTKVLIWYMRGNENTLQCTQQARSVSISVIRSMELVLGLRYKKELNALRRVFRICPGHP